MRLLKLIAPAFLAITLAGFSTHAGGAQTPDLECTQLSNTPDDGTPLAAAPTDLVSKKIDPSQAEAACRSALRADPANPNFMFLLGRALSLGNKRLEAIKYYLDAADRGHAGATNDLGGVFEYGIGVPKNLTTALTWYERAAEFGHAGAMTHMGQLSENGLHIPQDFANARHWYEMGAALGNAASMNNLANLYRYGREMAPNLPAAAHWYLKAAELGLASAMNSLGGVGIEELKPAVVIDSACAPSGLAGDQADALSGTARTIVNRGVGGHGSVLHSSAIMAPRTVAPMAAPTSAMESASNVKVMARPPYRVACFPARLERRAPTISR